MITFGQKHLDKYCDVCGLLLLLDGKCKRYHIIRPKRQKKYSGATKRMKGKYEDY